MDTQQVRVGKAVLQFFVIAIGATAGSYLAGWATDRFFGSRRAPVACLLMVGLGVLSLGYDFVVRHSVLGTMVILVVVGFCIYGPQVLLVGTAPADLAHRGTSAAAAGFVNFMGYLGAASGDVITGYYSVPEHGGWQFAIYIWAGWAFAGAVIMRVLWNTTASHLRVLHHSVPKLAAITAALVACAAVWLGQLAPILTIATAIAAACLCGTFATRWLAAPAVVVSSLALLVVIGSFFRYSRDMTWSQFAAIVAFGLVTITAVMILVERKSDEACEPS
jgi:MFS family permease